VTYTSFPGPTNGTIVTEFQSGDIAGAWMPEPYASKMIARRPRLVNEASLCPAGSTRRALVVRTDFSPRTPTS